MEYVTDNADDEDDEAGGGDRWRYTLDSVSCLLCSVVGGNISTNCWRRVQEKFPEGFHHAQNSHRHFSHS